MTASRFRFSMSCRSLAETALLPKLQDLTFFVKGEFVTGKEDVAMAQDGCYNVTKVDEKDFGSADMRHFEVGGA